MEKPNPRWGMFDNVYEDSKWLDVGGDQNCAHFFGKMVAKRKSGRVTKMLWDCKFCGLRRSVNR